jgi:flagellar biosynthesis protein FlhA
MAVMGQMAARTEKAAKAQPAPAPQKKKGDKEPVEELLEIDRVSVHVGVRLVGMVDPRRSETIFERIGALRRKFVQDLGIVIPLVRLRDDILLEPNAYEIRLSEVPIAKGHLEPSLFLAMDSGLVQNKVRGITTTEPVYGLPALWISPDDKEQAELSGYTVIDPESVFMTHLSESLRQHADELLTREDVQQLVERLRRTQPSLVGESLGASGEISVGLLQRVLRNLLREGIPIREMTTILEALAEHAPKAKSPTVLTEMVRKALCRTITQQFSSKDGRILALTFEPGLEHQMTSLVRQEGGELRVALPTELAMGVSRQVAGAWKAAMDKGLDRVVLLCDSRLRHSLADMLSRAVRMLPVLAYDEVVLGTHVEPVATIDVAAEGGALESKGQLVGAGLQ